MQIIADFHIHSYLSRATSKSMNIEEISRNGKLKGLGLIGTGDFTHPVWFAQIKEKLGNNETEGGSGIFEFDDMNWILTGEIATIYTQDNKTRKVHHVIHAPSIEVVEQINDALQKYGKLQADGRPILTGMTSPEFVETLMKISTDILVYPAHAWTSWFGVIGEFSGFDSLEECYQEQIKHIHALETGMSSDPLMNWRVSSLDNFTLLSNSDSHSPWVWRIGREANVFELNKLTYKAINDAIIKKDPKRLKFTIEVEPSYGKYHFTGHRKCGINIHPKEALKFDNKCPICRRKLTIGVMQRVEKLAQRAEGFKPDNAIPFKSLLPLYEVISSVTGVNRLYSKPVIEQQDRLIEKFGNEFNILLDAPKEELLKATSEKIADAIIKTRNGEVKYIPGYDGVYGVPVFSYEEYDKLKKKQVAKAKEQRSLKDFKSK
jgi:uncharacterized protein (TIGR00375 family)